jgi:hypothetical protein
MTIPLIQMGKRTGNILLSKAQRKRVIHINVSQIMAVRGRKMST